MNFDVLPEPPIRVGNSHSWVLTYAAAVVAGIVAVGIVIGIIRALKRRKRS